MCGIAGFIVNESEQDHESLLRRMGLAIAHRGPDDMGFFEVLSSDARHRVGLVHRRLSIIDLSTGDQPIGNEDGSVQVMFNGEIYNFQALRDELIALGHTFATASDTETIVHAYEQWGHDCVHRFRGMFAFALWDANKDEMFFARDRFGKKPLFLYQRDGVLLFGSEIKALLAFPGVAVAADKDAVWDYFAYRYAPGPATLFEGIRKLQPGHSAIWKNGALSEQRWFTPADCAPPGASAALPADPVAAFLDKLDESVRIRMISDVPFGAFLSGGIDSSAVVALMSRHSAQPVKTFSVGFKEGGFSELAYAGDIARQFGTDHHELEVSVDQVIELLPDLVRFRDAPVAEPSDIPIYLLAKEARKTVKMVLTGEGSDEILGGYPKHVYERYARPYQRVPAWLRRGVIEPGIGALPYRFRRAKTAIVNLGLEAFDERMARWFGMMSDREREHLVALRPSGRRTRELGCGGDSNTALRRILCFDQLSWLPDNLLERGDRMTMAASIEARMPFMDHDLAAFASTLPDHYRVRGHQTKWILREAMKQLLPAAILNRPKVGFRVPVNEWFRGQMKDYLYEHLTGAQSRTRDYYHPAALHQVLGEHVAGRQNHEKLLWSLLTLELWHRQYL